MIYKVVKEDGSPNFDVIFNELNNLAFNCNYEVEVTSSNDIVIAPSSRNSYPPSELPIVVGKYKKHGDVFWFEPEMQFSETLKDPEYRDSFYSHMCEWARAAKLADYLTSRGWNIHDEYED